MKVGIMQPYFFPYIGYWQLFFSVDKFVLLDDVNFIKRGYINRNSILINGNPHKFVIPLEKSSQNKLIMDTKLSFSEKERADFLKMIYMAYKKAPHFNIIYPMLEDIIGYKEDRLTQFIQHSLYYIKEYLDIKTEILLSSRIEKDCNLAGQDRIIALNKKLGSSLYINAIGGQKLYERDAFLKNGMDLKFLQTKPIKYTQFKNAFVPNLSFIDVLMFNTKNNIMEFLSQYNLI